MMPTSPAAAIYLDAPIFGEASGLTLRMVWEHACPCCKAAAGLGCITPNGYNAKTHAARVRAAKAARAALAAA
jgi:hypothetical protein